METVRKREAETRTSEVKAAENAIKITLLQNENRDLKEKLEERKEKQAKLEIKEVIIKSDNSK